ncbi:MAG TPA: response regulator transcription factor [Dehalococcoidia bacterium]|nr:response regulator transcription factor [Dehalococcoidia bacterium]
MPSKKAAVLVVDDDVHILRLMQRILELEGYRVLLASNGEAALDTFVKETPDLVLLDIMMPGMDGYTVCQRIREFSQVPIIMVTAKGNDQEKVRGLDAGADDYVTKPFSSKELAARVRAVLRRTALWEERPEPAFHFNDLAIDFARHRVTLGGQEVNLTATEYRLLSYLARNAGRVVTPDQILERVWGEEYLGESHLLQVNIARLRQKLKDDAKNPKYILTRPGIGYALMKQT